MYPGGPIRGCLILMEAPHLDYRAAALPPDCRGDQFLACNCRISRPEAVSIFLYPFLFLQSGCPMSTYNGVGNIIGTTMTGQIPILRAMGGTIAASALTILDFVHRGRKTSGR